MWNLDIYVIVIIRAVLMTKTYVEHIIIAGEDVSGAIGMMAVRINYGKSPCPALLERGDSQGGAIEIAHPTIEISAGMMVAKAGEDKGIIDFPPHDFIGSLSCPPGRV